MHCFPVKPCAYESNWNQEWEWRTAPLTVALFTQISRDWPAMKTFHFAAFAFFHRTKQWQHDVAAA